LSFSLSCFFPLYLSPLNSNTWHRTFDQDFPPGCLWADICYGMLMCLIWPLVFNTKI
jgi:hypothetical protein